MWVHVCYRTSKQGLTAAKKTVHTHSHIAWEMLAAAKTSRSTQTATHAPPIPWQSTRCAQLCINIYGILCARCNNSFLRARRADSETLFTLNCTNLPYPFFFASFVAALHFVFARATSKETWPRFHFTTSTNRALRPSLVCSPAAASPLHLCVVCPICSFVTRCQLAWVGCCVYV